MTTTNNVIILGAAGRDFHDFQTYWSLQPNTKVVCFTGTQIPGIENRLFPPELCNNDKNDNRYPDGVMIYPESQLEELIKKFDATTCTMAYSDSSYDTVQHLAARVNAAGCQFVQLPPKFTQLSSSKPVIAVCASRTGCGKSQTTRFIADHLKKKGKKIAVVRHPMPYNEVLLKQRCQRYEKLEDMERYECTIEEREEYELHIKEGNLLFAGVDYEMILREAEKEADVVIWDGGNNDTSFFRPDLSICVVDALRPSHEEHFYPGEINVRMADLVLISKVNALPDLHAVKEQAQHIHDITKAPVLYGNSVVTVEAIDKATGKLLERDVSEAMVRGKRVLVIDDGPTLTHGGMAYGAGYALAKQLGAAEIIDPRPHAKGSLDNVFKKFTHLKEVLPAMGYSEDMIKDLEATVDDVDCDCIIVGTPSDLKRVMKLNKPWVRARYNLELVPEHNNLFDGETDSVFARFASRAA